MRHMALLDAQHVERLDPIGTDAVRLARLHQRIGNALAETGRHRQLEGQFAGEGNAE
ncbi:hypothetical protein D3C72_2586350 [compost metagenome]